MKTVDPIPRTRSLGVVASGLAAILLAFAWMIPAPVSSQAPGRRLPDTGATDGRTVRLLQRLIAFDTSHPPGTRDRSFSASTISLAEFLEAQFVPLGAEITIHRGPENRAAHFIARLRGDGSKKPILLAAHADVVPVEREHWATDPFAGIVKDGYVYGRGALDFKGGLAVFARAAMMLAENRVPLARDVILLAEADEEEGNFDTDWLARNHWSDIDAEFVLNEGGWILQGEGGDTQQVNITTADKVAVNFTLTARGTPTHSSRPLRPQETAIGKLVPALARLLAHDFEPRLTEQTRACFLALARTSSGPLAADLRTLAQTPDPKERSAAAKRVVDGSRYPLLMSALMHDTVAITLLDAGVKRNVIPGSAQATVNVRLLPGSTTDDVLARLKSALADPGIEIAFTSKMQDPRAHYLARTSAPASSIDTALYRALEKHARDAWPRAEVVPALFEAGTDAGPWRERGIPVYGVYPYPVDPETLVRMHGNDERVGIAQLEQGTAWVYQVLREVAGR